MLLAKDKRQNRAKVRARTEMQERFCSKSTRKGTQGSNRLRLMPSKDRATYDPPEKSGGEGWLVSAEQQLLCQFKPDSATVHAQWVAVRTYSWVPPRPPVPQTRRRMLRHNAIEAWETMLKTGWRRCSPPVR